VNYQRFLFPFAVGLLFTALLLSHSGGWASETPALLSLEIRWLNNTYEAEPVENRLERLEQTLFGESHGNEPAEQRLETLQQLFVRYPASGTSTETPSVTTPTAELEPVIDSTAAMTSVSPPLLGALEKVILHRRFDDQPDGDRLNRLEWKTFLTTFPSQPLDERLDRLVRRYPQAIEVARSVVNYQQLQSQQLRSSQTAPVYTPPQIRPAIRP